MPCMGETTDITEIYILVVIQVGSGSYAKFLKLVCIEDQCSLSVLLVTAVASVTSQLYYANAIVFLFDILWSVLLYS